MRCLPIRLPAVLPAALPAVAVLLAGCTSFTDAAPATSGAATSAPSSGPSSGPSSAGGGDLAVIDDVDLDVAAPDVSSARLAAGGDDPAVLLVGASSTLVEGSRTTRLEGLAPTDVVLVDGGPVVVGLAADPVAGDPVLALLGPDDDAPQPVEPQRTAPRGVPVLAAAGSSGGEDVVHVLAEDADDLAATVLTVDPATGEVQADVDLDLSGDLGDDVTSIDLVGLAATDDGLVAGLDVRAADGTTTGRLVTLDDDLRQTGGAEVLDEPLLALTADGDPVTAADLAGAEDARVAGAASTGSSTVVVLLDQRSPTVLVTGDGDDPTTLELCDDEGDALAVARADDGSVLVAGTCDGTARLWTLG